MKMPILLALTLPALVANADQNAAPSLPRPMVTQDPAAAVSGSYALDPRHASTIVRIAHGGGTSFSTFRFGTQAATLDWNAAAPAASKLSVRVDMASIQTPVANFATDLVGDHFLKTAQFPEATFTSTHIETTGATTGRITGSLTFMGVTKPMTIDARLVGIGKGMRGASVIGFSGVAHFRRSDYGMTTMLGMIGDDVELLLDAEFSKPA